jgi:hypothetical protein
MRQINGALFLFQFSEGLHTLEVFAAQGFNLRDICPAINLSTLPLFTQSVTIEHGLLQGLHSIHIGFEPLPVSESSVALA